jgi:hypothetical protein
MKKLVLVVDSEGEDAFVLGILLLNKDSIERAFVPEGEEYADFMSNCYFLDALSSDEVPIEDKLDTFIQDIDGGYVEIDPMFVKTRGLY